MAQQPGEVPDSTTPSPSAFARLRADAHVRLNRWTRASHQWITSHPRTFRTITGIVVALALLMAVAIYEVIANLPGRSELKALGERDESTVVYDRFDRPIFSIPAQYQIEVTLSQISPNLKKAVIAVEDARFYEHNGVDGIRILGAVVHDLRKARKAEGASTITQQLARMSFLSADKTLRRKITEAILAQRLEKLYSKDEILEFYLNKVYFGDGLFGAEAASRGYFGKSAADLTPAEAALLAGLVRAPSSTNPTINPDKALARRNIVLKAMRDNKLIDQGAYDTAMATQIVLNDNLRKEDPSGVHFKEQVRRELIDRFGKDATYDGHLKVYTTIDTEMQRAAEAAVVSSLTELDARTPPPRPGKNKPQDPKSGDKKLQAALVALDPATGEVRAIVGGRDVTSVGLNRALQSKRQPGSAFKPFLYAAALEAGYTPATVIQHLDQPITTYKGAWLPEDEHSTASSMTVRAALRTSSNRAAVQTINAVGISRAVSIAKRFGLGEVPSVPALALGAGEVTLLSMTSAYAAFAQAGIARDAIFIKRVDDASGRTIYTAERHDRQVISPATAFLMSSILADVVNAGTAVKARSLGFTLPAAGKTGTTNDFVDAWFVGFTPRLVAGVWVGYDEPRTIMANGFAADVAVPMWAKFMKAATSKDPKDWFQPPADVVSLQVCRISGLLAGPSCRNVESVDADGNITSKSTVYTEYFVRGTEPTQVCDAHAADLQPVALPSDAAPPDSVPPVSLPSAPAETPP